MKQLLNKLLERDITFSIEILERELIHGKVELVPLHKLEERKHLGLHDIFMLRSEYFDEFARMNKNDVFAIVRHKTSKYGTSQRILYAYQPSTDLVLINTVFDNGTLCN